MEKTNEIYVGAITYVNNKSSNSDYEVSGNLAELKREILEKIIDYYVYDFPTIAKYRTTNSVYFMSPDEERYQKNIDFVCNYLNGEGEKVSSVFIKIEPVIKEDIIENLNHDIV